MSLAPRETKYLVIGISTAVVTLSETASQMGAFSAMGVWGQLLVKAIFLGAGLMVGWMNMRQPESMRPPPMDSKP